MRIKLSKKFSSLEQVVACKESIEKCWEKNIITFANLSNLTALMGGSLKKEQVISGLMADLFSQCYLSQAVIWDYKTRGMKNHKSMVLVLEQLNMEFGTTLTKIKQKYKKRGAKKYKISWDKESF